MRRYWPEYPHPAFFGTLFLILLSLAGAASGAWEDLAPGTLPLLTTSSGLTTDKLAGLSTKRTRAIFGTPAFIRHEPPAEIWQYRTEACVLDLYVYPAVNNRQSVRFAELRNRGEAKLASSDCLRDLANAAN